jgi:GNAT superfamily N-acetyltransferase
VFNVRRQAFRKCVELAEGWDDGRELERHIERFGRQRFRVTVVEAADVGYMATAVYPATANSPASLYLHQLMLLPSFQSRGIGSVCVRLLEHEARELSMPIRLRVLRVNPRALALYLASGYEIVGESDSHVTLERHV